MSTTPMKMGVERVLKKKFGDELKEIYQVDQQNIHATIVVRTPKAFSFLWIFKANYHFVRNGSSFNAICLCLL